jgi:hypothetical protein
VPTWSVLAAGTSNGNNDLGCVQCSMLAPVLTHWESQAGTCSACKSCNTSEYVFANCTSSADTSCWACPQCVSGTSYYSRNCSTYLPSVCTTCDTACLLGHEYETSPCTLFTNRKCVPCSTSCPAGQYLTANCTATENIKCAPCRNCTTGEYASVACTPTIYGKNRECTSCAPGYFSSSVNVAACSQCLAGTYAPEAKATTCLGCSAGTFVAGAGASQCLACGEGKYSIVSGVSTCTTCPAATYLKNASLGTCLLCPAGTYNFKDGMTYCKSCQPGTFSPVPSAAVNNTNCTKCPVGYATSATGTANNCSACAPGTYAGVTGLSSCLQCPAGTYANFTAASACVACGPGNFSASAGASNCAPCPAGTRSNLTSRSTSCATCTAGTFASGLCSSQCLTCSADCVVGQRYVEVNCTAATDRKCSPCCRNPACPVGQTSNVTWCPADGWFSCIACPAYGNDYVHLNAEYSCLKCPGRNCGLTPGTYELAPCPLKTNFTIDDTFSCGRCPGCSYRQRVVDWGFCDCKGSEYFQLNPEFDQHCAYCNTTCKPGQYVTNLCTGRTKANTKVCVNCTSCAWGFYHAGKLPGKTYPQYEGMPWTVAEPEPSCDGRGIQNSDGVTDCARCDTCAFGKYASDVKRCTGNWIWKDNFTCTDCKPCPSGYEHVVPCDGLSFNDSCKVCPACSAGFHAVSAWNSTLKKMICGCKKCLDAKGDVCAVHSFKTNKTCRGKMQYDEACEECSLCNAGEYIAGGAFCTGATYEDTSAAKCRYAVK